MLRALWLVSRTTRMGGLRRPIMLAAATMFAPTMVENTISGLWRRISRRSGNNDHLKRPEPRSTGSIPVSQSRPAPDAEATASVGRGRSSGQWCTRFIAVRCAPPPLRLGRKKRERGTDVIQFSLSKNNKF